MKFLKNPILALTSVMLLLGALAVPTASALPGSTVFIPPGIKPYVNPNNVGQVIIFPYYTVRDGQKSFFNVTNTTSDTLALKIRFHESLNSRDALDFVVVLSPYDVWTAWIEDGPDAPLVKSSDKSCVVGAPNIRTTGQKLSAIAYDDTDPIFEDQPLNSIERTREGYMVVQVMGVVPGKNAVNNADEVVDSSAVNETQAGILGTNTWSGSVAYNAYHVDGIPRNCAAVNSAFVATAPQLAVHPFTDTIVTPVLGDGDPKAALEFSSPFGAKQQNALKGNFSIINDENGVGAGKTAVAIADMIGIGTYGITGISLVTAQNFPYFLEPTLASGKGLWTVLGLPEVEFALTSVGISNEWAQNPNTGALTDWVVTFPTKSFHVDNRNSLGIRYLGGYTPVGSGTLAVPASNIQSAANVWRVGSLTLTGVFKDNLDINGAAVSVKIAGFDREEHGVLADNDNTTPSPAPPSVVDLLVLQGEANIITFGPDASSFLGGNSVLGAKNFVLNFDIVDALGNNVPNGWAGMAWTDIEAFDNGGLPVIGYVYKARNQGDPTKAYGQLMEHTWIDVVVTPN